MRMRWVGRMPKLWKSVVQELQIAQEQTKDNDELTLYFCMNYGGRAEIADAAQAIAEDVKAGRLDPSKVNEKTFAKYLYYPDMPDVDLFLRPSGEQRTSNYLIWQSAYAEMVFQDVLWPDFDRRDLWRACLEYAAARPPLRRRASPTRSRSRTVSERGRARTGPSARCGPSSRTSRYLLAHSCARPEDLHRVRHVHEAVLGGDRLGPLLDRGALDLDGLAADAADQMVVVVAGASSGGRPTRPRWCAGRRPRRRRRGTEGCGRPWSDRPSRPCA